MTKSQDIIMIGKQTLIIIKTIYKKNEIAERSKNKLVWTAQYNRSYR